MNQRRKAWLTAQLPHQVALEDVYAEADYRRFKDFYSADTRRHGDDIVLSEVGDRELIWSVVFIPGTGEVAAFALRWLDEHWHFRLYGLSGTPTAYFTARGTPGPQRIPELVVVLGRAESAEGAAARLGSATTLDAIRACFHATP